MPPINHAYVQATPGGPASVVTRPYTSPDAGQLTVKTGAVAINPIDCFKARFGRLVFPWCEYPLVMGIDVAGTVVEVGAGVTRFRVGDRVMACCVGTEKGVNRGAESAFQEYVVVRQGLTAQIPASMSFEEASVFPLAMCTAASAMYVKEYLGLPLPHPDRASPTGDVLLVWGGSTSVGCCAIQLAAASGVAVVATASPRNFEYVKRLGAAAVFDYRSPTVVRDIVAYLRGNNDNNNNDDDDDGARKQKLAGALAIGEGSLGPCFAIVGQAGSSGRKFVAQVSTAGSMPQKVPKSPLDWAALVSAFASANVRAWAAAKARGVRFSFVPGTALQRSEVGDAVWRDLLPAALARGTIVPAPEPLVVGEGLDKIDKAFETSAAGVSAKKVVVRI